MIINAFNEISGMNRKWIKFSRRGKTEPEVMEPPPSPPEVIMKSELEHMAEVVKGFEESSKSVTSFEIGEDRLTSEMDEGKKKRFKFKCCC